MSNDFKPHLTDLIDLDELQRMQDAFSSATGVASIITESDGTPITKPSNFCRLCISIIRNTEKGLRNCMRSDAVIGKHNPEGPIMQPCLSGGLWDGGASITVGGQHIANWLIGQVRNEAQDEVKMLDYAREIGADPEEFLIALREVPQMTVEQFKHICDALFIIAKQVSTLAFQNAQKAILLKERDESLKALEASEKRYKQIIETSLEGIWVVDSEINTTFVNQRTTEMLGYSAEEMIGRPFTDFIVEEEIPHHEALMQIRRKGGAGNYERRFRTRDCNILTMHASASPLMDDDGSFKGSFVMLTDITERKKAVEALAAESERLAVTLQSIGDGVIATDINGHVMLMSKAAEQMTGWLQGDARGKHLDEIFVVLDTKSREPIRGILEKVISGGNAIILPAQSTLLDRSGAGSLISDSLAPILNKEGRIIGIVIVFRDVTVETKLQADIQKAAKLESIGVLAGGIAHDFNNLLTGISGNIGLARSSLAKDDPLRTMHYLDEVENASIRAKELTRQLLTFAKGGAPVKTVMNIHNLIRDASSFALTGSKNRLLLEIEHPLWPTAVDEGQFSQVLHNLVLNADQSMQEAGDIVIQAENIEINRVSGTPLAEGPYVKISVKDHGAGIPAKYLSKIFDPFFTTKQKGSGLGLTSVFSIIRAHGGHVSVESSLGYGSKFTVFLPAMPGAAIDAAEQIADTGLTETLHILAMDDEPMLRQILEDYLSGLGHKVKTVAEGNLAINELRKVLQNGQNYDLAILDLTVPGGLGGKDVVLLLKELDPKLRILASSGYANDPVMSNYAEYGFDGILPKPYRLSELQAVLKSVMNPLTSSSQLS